MPRLTPRRGPWPSGDGRDPPRQGPAGTCIIPGLTSPTRVRAARDSATRLPESPTRTWPWHRPTLRGAPGPMPGTRVTSGRRPSASGESRCRLREVPAGTRAIPTSPSGGDHSYPGEANSHHREVNASIRPCQLSPSRTGASGFKLPRAPLGVGYRQLVAPPTAGTWVIDGAARHLARHSLEYESRSLRLQGRRHEHSLADEHTTRSCLSLS